MKVAYLTNASATSGVGGYAHQLASHFNSTIAITEITLGKESVHENGRTLHAFRPWPGVFGSKSVGWIRGARKLTPRFQEFDVVHATNQTLSFIQPHKPFVVTVHDIIELLEPQDKKAAFLNRYLYSGISRADHIITVSAYTKQSLQNHYHIPDTSITVIHNGVNHAVFYPIPNLQETIGYQTIRQQLKLEDHHPIVLYVGSEHPRKNVLTAVRAFAALKKVRPDALFIKVGAPGLSFGRKILLEEMDRLGIHESVRFTGVVSDEQLNILYNVATVFLFPSTFEGFGLPVLQAMATGTPVICSSTTSLPEITGTAARMHDPSDQKAFSASLQEITQDTEIAKTMSQAGIIQAKKFSWEKAAQATQAIYSLFSS